MNQQNLMKIQPYKFKQKVNQKIFNRNSLQKAKKKFQWKNTYKKFAISYI